MGSAPTSSTPTTRKRLRVGVVIATGLATILIGCGDPPPPPPPGVVSITPMCTILCNADQASNEWNGRVFVADRTGPGGTNFTPLRAMSGPLGFLRPGRSGVPNAFAVSEAWLRGSPGSDVVMRGLAMPTWGRPPDENWDHGSKWSIDWQAGSTRLGAGDGWMGTLDTGSANWSASDSDRRYDVDSRETAAWTVPQLMPVGVYEQHVFGCAGGRTQNDAGRTTWLVEAIPGAIPPNPGDRGRVSSIQDLLYGDDKFVYSNEPLALEKKPPTPNVSGPGDPSGGWGAVQCAMAQGGDDRTTRELHMINVAKGHLVHAVASRWGTATRDDGATFNRFGAISGWSDVSQELGVNFGTITSAAVVPRSSALDVFFVAAAGGRYRLWHTVRFPDGSWRPAKDVFALSGDAPNGTVNEIDGVAAANCPANGAGTSDASSTETTVAIWDGPIPNQVLVIRMVPTPQQWQTGVTGVYAPWQHVPMGELGARDGKFALKSVAVTARPFRDDLMPVP